MVVTTHIHKFVISKLLTNIFISKLILKFSLALNFDNVDGDGREDDEILHNFSSQCHIV